MLSSSRYPLNLLLSFTFCWVSLSGISQSKEMMTGQALNQIQDLKHGTLLIPLNPAQNAIVQGAQSMEWAIAREENEQLRKAFSRHFSLCEVLFFYPDSLEMGTVFDASMKPVDSPFFDRQTFIAHFHDSSFVLKPDVIEHSKKADRRRARQRAASQKHNQKMLDWQKEQIAKVDARIARNRDDWTHLQFERALALRAYYENYFEPTEYEKELAFFAPDGTGQGGFVIERTTPVHIVKNKRKSYSFNMQINFRDYQQVDVTERFIRLAENVEAQIQSTELLLLKKMNQLEKLKN